MPEASKVAACPAAEDSVVEAWRRFVASTSASTTVRPVIVDSWRRSQRAGVSPDDAGLLPRRVVESELRRRLAASEALVQSARAHLEWLSAGLAEVPHVAYVTDRDGIVLYSVGDPSLQTQFGLEPGYDWSEPAMGSNGAGTALAIDQPVAVIGAEHFRVAFHDCTCTAAPVHLDGQVIGAIDVSTRARDATPDRLMLVSHIAYVIDRELRDRAALEREAAYRQLAEALRQSEEHLRQVLEKLPVGICLCDTDGLITYFNGEAVRLWGRTPAVRDSIDRYCGSFRMRSADGAPVAPEDSWMGLALREGRPYHGQEVVIERPDGRRRTVLVHVSPLTDPGGRMYGAINGFIDITERKRTEAHSELLASELTHRVKNTLAVVQAIASQTMRRAHTVDQIRASFGGRLNALAAAHDLLFAQHWAEVGLRELLERTLAPVVPGERVDLEGRAVTLSANAAVSLGMAVHELAINASKYGALCTREGRIQIAWSVAADPAPQLTIEWRESGGPAPVEPQAAARGFGSRLIERVARELDASVEKEWNASGLVCRLRLPVGPHVALH